MYTVALAVVTLPQTMLAFCLPTVNISPEPLTVTVVPASVVWSPAILSGAIFPATTWFVTI